MNLYSQTPNEIYHYRQPVVGDTIVSAVWSVSPSGPTISTVETTTTHTTCSLSDVVSGILYTITCLLTVTSGQRVEVKTLVKGAA